MVLGYYWLVEEERAPGDGLQEAVSSVIQKVGFEQLAIQEKPVSGNTQFEMNNFRTILCSSYVNFNTWEGI